MIGRFSKPGSYKELLKFKDFFRVGLGGLLALAGYLWDWGSEPSSAIGLILILSSVAVNGLPIVWEAIKGLIDKQVNVHRICNGKSEMIDERVIFDYPIFSRCVYIVYMAGRG